MAYDSKNIRAEVKTSYCTSRSNLSKDGCQKCYESNQNYGSYWQKETTYFNPIQDGLFRDCSRTWEGQNLSHISCSDETWDSYTLHKEDPRHSPWVLLKSAFFHRKSANFAISRNTDINCILIHNFYLF